MNVCTGSPSFDPSQSQLGGRLVEAVGLNVWVRVAGQRLLLAPTRLSTRFPLDFLVEGSPCGGHERE